MRLIDADELKTAFPCGESVRTECVRETIDHMLTIQPEPERKKGEWIQRQRYDGDTQPMLECPYCQNKVGWWDLARYCDFCGARLKGSAGDLDERLNQQTGCD